MKVVIYYNLPFGGAKRAVQEHVKGLRQGGHIVDVYTTDEAKDIFDPGIYASNEYRYLFEPKKIKFPILSRIIRDFHVFFTLRKLHKKIAKEIDLKSYDIVLVHHDVSTNSPYILRFLKTKNVYYCMEPLRMVYEYALRVPNDLNIFNKLYENINRYIRKNIDRTNTLAADNTITLSHFGQEYMIRAYNLFPPIINLGVDTDVFKPITAKKKNQVLFLAEKYPIYGYDFAVDAINLIPKSKRPELKVVFGTKGKNYRISDTELVKIYNESIATLSLSKFDTFGLVPLESMACGIPVIAFNVAGYRETIVNGKTGFLVDFEPKEIAEKITFLMNNVTAAQQMGIEGRKNAEMLWTWQKQVDKLEDILQSLMKQI